MAADLTKHIPNIPRTLADDPWLEPFRGIIRERMEYTEKVLRRCCGRDGALVDFASGHEYFGLHRQPDGSWLFREWAPNAERIFLVGDFSDWQERSEFSLQRMAGTNGHWAIRLPESVLRHGTRYRLRIHWPHGCGDRIPAYARRVVQDSGTKIFCAEVWQPDTPYMWQNRSPEPSAPLIYEAHVGMSLEAGRVGTFVEFRDGVLPRIAAGGYNTIQLMAVMEHPYYGSFGYHVSSFFAASSRFGSPDDLKSLVDAAHGMGLRVIMDLVHSHAVRNEVEGLARFDGTPYQFFHDGTRGLHPAWDSCCFDYGKPEVIHFLLSNCRFWLDEYHMDGFRFDGITSMLYRHHGLGTVFSGYESYFNDSVDTDALAYLALANRLIHRVRPDAVTIAEDVSGMPGLAAPVAEGGNGFDYRLAMGVTDFWFRLLDIPDEDWPIAHLWKELTERRADEKTISYVECHDQAIVGGQTAIFRLIGDDMYHNMHRGGETIRTDRGIVLHNILRLLTLATAGNGYLNFMGNEFGHPEWIDFPREGNNWSYHHARRLWSLADDPNLLYHFMRDFDAALLRIVSEFTVFRACPRLLAVCDVRKILVFERAGLVFLINLHPAHSLPDFEVEVMPGDYEQILCTDDPAFGGHGRVPDEQRFQSQSRTESGILKHTIRVYLPCRTAIVFRHTRFALPQRPDGGTC